MLCYKCIVIEKIRYEPIVSCYGDSRYVEDERRMAYEFFFPHGAMARMYAAADVCHARVFATRLPPSARPIP